MTWDFSTEPEFEKKLEWMREFVLEEVYPLEVLEANEKDFMLAIWHLQQQVKKQKLWATHLPPELGGQGYGQVKLGLMHEIEGASVWAPIVFGNQAPDSGNSEVLAHFGTEEQKKAASAARRQDPLGFFDDGAEHGRVRSDAALHHGSARWGRVGDQRAQMVHVERHDR